MPEQRVPITHFRSSLTPFCRAVKRGKMELIVTYYYDDLFKVVQITNESESGVKFQLTHVRDKITEFLDLLEEQKTVILTSHGKQLVVCKLL